MPLCSVLLMVCMAMRLWAIMTMVMMSRSIRLSMTWYGGGGRMMLAHGGLLGGMVIVPFTTTDGRRRKSLQWQGGSPPAPVTD